MKRIPFPIATATLTVSTLLALEPIPDKLVVLTFDDSVKSHCTVAGPLLKRYGFGATFYITEGFSFPSNKIDYMTWEEIAELHRDGFEIGNHTRDHMGVTASRVPLLEEQLSAIDAACAKYGIPRPTTFAWPGNGIAIEALPVLEAHGIGFARRGGSPEFPAGGFIGPVYNPVRDDPMLIPSVGIPRPGFDMSDFVTAVSQAKNGRIAVLQFHGVPEGEHPWVHVSQARFEAFMKYLYDNEFKVIALRDLARYVDASEKPEDPWTVIAERQAFLKKTSASQRSTRWSDLPTPDHSNFRYDDHERNTLDLWLAGTTKPTPLVVFFHGGGFRSGDKSKLNPLLLRLCLNRGVSVAAANYRLS